MGKLARLLEWTGRQFSLCPILEHFRNAGLGEDCRPNKVRHYYTILIQGRYGTVVDCLSLDNNSADFVEICGDP